MLLAVRTHYDVKLDECVLCVTDKNIIDSSISNQTLNGISSSVLHGAHYVVVLGVYPTSQRRTSCMMSGRMSRLSKYVRAGLVTACASVGSSNPDCS